MHLDFLQTEDIVIYIDTMNAFRLGSHLLFDFRLLVAWSGFLFIVGRDDSVWMFILRKINMKNAACSNEGIDIHLKKYTTK